MRLYKYLYYIALTFCIGGLILGTRDFLVIATALNAITGLVKEYQTELK